MFVFRTKRDSDGRFLKFKARLTFRGDQQDDVGDTWAPTIHTETWKFLLALGTRLDLEMSQMDIASAFLKEHMPPEMDELKDALTFWEKQDKYSKDKYEEDLKTFTDYSTFCGTIDTHLGVLGPTGTEKNKLFGGDKLSIGPDEATQLQLHQVLAALQALRGHYSINAHEALTMLEKIHEPSRPFAKQSGTEFHAYSRKLYEFFQMLDATIPDPAPGAARELPHFSIKFLCGLLKASVATGAHGVHVNKLLDDMVKPQETAASFDLWLNSAYIIINDQAKKSSEERLAMPKLTATVAKKEPVTKKAVPPTYEELNEYFKTYCMPTTAGAPKHCPYPHLAYSKGHHGHECRNTAKIVQKPDFVNKSIRDDVLKSLKELKA